MDVQAVIYEHNWIIKNSTLVDVGDVYIIWYLFTDY